MTTVNMAPFIHYPVIMTIINIDRQIDALHRSLLNLAYAATRSTGVKGKRENVWIFSFQSGD